MTQDQRKYSRVPLSDQPCQVDFGDSSYSCLLADDSITGFSVIGLNLLVLKTNQPICASVGDVKITGICRNISRMADNQFRVGIEKDMEAFSEYSLDLQRRNDSHLVQCFFNVDGIRIKVKPLVVNSDRRLLIRLPDNTELTTPVALVSALVRDERIAELQSESIREKTSAFYRDLVPKLDFDCLNSIADYEFGRVEPRDLKECLDQTEIYLKASG